MSNIEKRDEYRQHVACMALIALIQKHPAVVGGSEIDDVFRRTAIGAVEYADRLIEALERT